jgi:hypothetical protein
MDEAAIEATLNGDRLANRDHLPVIAFTSEVHKRPPRWIGDDELVTEDLSHPTTDRDDSARRQRMDCDRGCRRH